jgi:hypothetical protein
MSRGELAVQSDDSKVIEQRVVDGSTVISAGGPALTDPRAVLSLLEADQVVAAKRRTHFGRQQLSTRTRFLLWGLRVYVVVMFAIVAVSVFRALHSAH